MVASGEIVGKGRVARGEFRNIEAVAATSAFTTLPIADVTSEVSSRVVLKDNLEAPIQKGQVIGIVEIIKNGKVVGSVDALALRPVGVGGPLSIIGIPDSFIYGVAKFFGALLLIVFLLRIRAVRLKNRRKCKNKTNPRLAFSLRGKNVR